MKVMPGAAGASMVGRVRLAMLVVAGGVLAFAFGLVLANAPREGLAVLVALAGGVVLLWRPVVGFFLVVASLPLDVTGTLGGGGGFTVVSLTKILALVTVGAVLFDTLLRQRPLNLHRLATPETLLLILLIGVMVASTAVHPSQESVAEIIRQGVILVFVLVMVWFVDRPERLRQLMLTVALAGTAIAMHSMFQRVTRPVSVSEEWVAEAGAVLDVGEENIGEMLRTTGTFSHPAWLGLFLSICVPFTLGLAWNARHLRWRLAGHVAVGLQLLGILSTYSRMAYIGAAVALGLFALRRRFGLALIAAACGIAIIAFPALPEDFRNRVYSIVEYHASSSSLSRVGQQIAGLSMFLDHPMLGVGPGNFEDRVMPYQSRVPVPFEVQPIGAHNMYVEVAAELGAIGLALVLMVLAQNAWQLRQLRRHARHCGDPKQAMLWECVGIALAVFAVSALFVHAQYRKEWWLLVGLAAAGRQFLAPAGEPVRPQAQQPEAVSP